MGQNKMEKDFRNKLNQREIKPSENAWDRLDAMLTVAEEKKPKRDYGWMYIAAGFLGFLFIGTMFFSQTQEMIDVRRNNAVIENTNSPKSENSNEPQTILSTPASETIAAVNQKSIKNQSSNPSKSHQSINQTAAVIQQSNQNPTLIASNNPIINQKTEQQTQTVPAKVDELLATVATTPNNEKAKAIKVNAKSLLSEVDGEINLSFRSKILRKVSKNYQEVAEAVSNRNAQE